MPRAAFDISCKLHITNKKLYGDLTTNIAEKAAICGTLQKKKGERDIKWLPGDQRSWKTYKDMLTYYKQITGCRAWTGETKSLRAARRIRDCGEPSLESGIRQIKVSDSYVNNEWWLCENYVHRNATESLLFSLMVMNKKSSSWITFNFRLRLCERNFAKSLIMAHVYAAHVVLPGG